MATLREVKNRIRGVRSTRRITRAMEMVAAAKLRKAQQRVEQAKPYARKLDQMLGHLAAASEGEISHPYFEEREVKRKTLLLVTADKGLCGSFNSNLVKRADLWLQEHEGIDRELFLIGKKGWDYYRRRDWRVLEHLIGFEGEIDYARAREVVDRLTGRFVNEDTDAVDILYTQFVSMGTFRVTLDHYLPIPRPKFGGDERDDAGVAAAKEYIFEPNAEAIYAKLLPYYTTTKLITVLTESFASEQGARMLAMNAATKAAGDMIDTLTLEYNKARQAQITKELLEIVSGAEALKG
jgi:F-type H+-transporting ATPase subunit gamma